MSMNRGYVGRFVSVLLTAAFLGSYVYRDSEEWIVLGRNAFLAHEAHRFDTFISRSLLVHSIEVAIVAIGLLALYEALNRIVNAILARF